MKCMINKKIVLDIQNLNTHGYLHPSHPLYIFYTLELMCNYVQINHPLRFRLKFEF